jgi:hypothetical protein
MNTAALVRSIFGMHDDGAEGCERCAALETIVVQITTLDAELRATREALNGAHAEARILRARLANAEAGVMGGK